MNLWLVAIAVGAAIGIVHGVGERSLTFGLKVTAVSSLVAVVLLSAGL